MSEKAGRVLVAGSINMDIVARVERHPKPGETLPGSTLAYFPGGKGANQAVAASRAGAETLMLGAVGGDAFGTDLASFLSSRGVATDQIEVVKESPTGTALILVDDEGENSIVVVPGANGFVDPELVRSVAPMKGDVLVTQFETPTDAAVAFFAAGSAVGATCVLNPAPASLVPDELLCLVDVLVVNESELGVVAQHDVGDSPTIDDIRSAAGRLEAAGFRGTLVTTLGSRGSVSLMEQRVIEIPGIPVLAVDTTGAGDCFVGYLAAGLARGDDVVTALNTANVAASICVQRAGAGPSMPDRAEVEKVLGSR